MSDEDNCCSDGAENWIHVLGPRMASMLRRMEWAAWEGPDSCCPVCHEWKTDGHEPDCELATLLRELP